MAVIVVTGASQGMGRAIAEAFAGEAGACIALVARNEEKLKEVAQACEASGAETAVFPCDVTDEAQVQQMVAGVTKQWGTPDVLINNAGVFHPGSLVETTLASFRYQLDVNLVSAFMVTQGFLKAMLDQGKGTIYYMASVAAMKAI